MGCADADTRLLSQKACLTPLHIGLNRGGSGGGVPLMVLNGPLAGRIRSCNSALIMILSLLVVSLMSQGTTAATPADMLDADLAAERLTRCDIGPFTRRPDDLLPEDEIFVVPAASGLTDKQIACAEEAAGLFTLELPANEQTRFDALREIRARNYAQASSREWADQHGLTDRVPLFTEGQDDPAAFALRIEELCGPETAGALQSEYGPHSVSPAWIDSFGQDPSAAAEALSCVWHLATLAGFDLYLVGNDRPHTPVR